MRREALLPPYYSILSVSYLLDRNEDEGTEKHALILRNAAWKANALGDIRRNVFRCWMRPKRPLKSRMQGQYALAGVDQGSQ